MNNQNLKKEFLNAVAKNYPEELHRFLKEHWMTQTPKKPSSFIPLSLLFEQSFFKAEALKVYPQAVNHRDSYLSKGWKSICLHGLSSEKTQSYRTYGFPTQDDAPYQWTELTQWAPHTTRYLQENIPMMKWFRVRWMFLEPWGYILPHQDYDPKTALHPPGFNAINLAITHPAGCLFIVENEGEIPFRPGNGFYFNGAKSHALINHSPELRIHMIIHGKPDPQLFPKLLNLT